MASNQTLHAVVASNGACRRRPVILSTAVRTTQDKTRTSKLVREFEPARNPKTRRV